MFTLNVVVITKHTPLTSTNQQLCFDHNLNMDDFYSLIWAWSSVTLCRRYGAYHIKISGKSDGYIIVCFDMEEGVIVCGRGNHGKTKIFCSRAGLMTSIWEFEILKQTVTWVKPWLSCAGIWLKLRKNYVFFISSLDMCRMKSFPTFWSFYQT